MEVSTMVFVALNSHRSTVRHQKMQRRACIASRMLSSNVVSPRQTLRELTRDTSGTAHAFTYACASQCAHLISARLELTHAEFRVFLVSIHVSCTNTKVTLVTII